MASPAREHIWKLLHSLDRDERAEVQVQSIDETRLPRCVLSTNTADEDFGRILRVYLVLEETRLEIMWRSTRFGFGSSLEDAKRLARSISVPYRKGTRRRR